MDLLAAADRPTTLKFLEIPPLAALFPARPTPVAALGSHGPEHTAPLSQLSALCYICLIMQDRIRDTELWEGGPDVTQPGAQAQPLLLGRNLQGETQE